MKGEEPTDTKSFRAKDSFIMAKLYKKTIILLAGIAMNLLTARALFAVVFWAGIDPIRVIPENLTTVNNTSLIMPTLSHLHNQGYIEGVRQPGPVHVDMVITGSLADQAGIQS